MAIPSTPQNFIAQTGNRQNFISWDLSVGATSYTLQRSTDQVTYTTIASPVITSYLDSSVSIGIQYYYQVAAVNSSGTSSYSSPQSVIPSPTAEMSLGQIRLMAQQKSDMVNNSFVTNSEWNTYINLAMFELYDLLVMADADLFTAAPAIFQTDGTTYLYPLPDGSNFNGALPFFKLMGLDLGINNSINAWVTIDKFNFIDRNKWVYPNSTSTALGPFNLRYRLVGSKIEFIPIPTMNQSIRIWYIPRLYQLLQDTDITTIGFSGWLQYVIVRAAKYAIDKQQLDSTAVDQELLFLKDRIESTSSNRDIGRPDTISDVSTTSDSGAFGPYNGFRGGF